MLRSGSAVMKDGGVSTAEMTQNSTLRLIADFFNVMKYSSSNDYDYASNLSTVMNNIT